MYFLTRSYPRHCANVRTNVLPNSLDDRKCLFAREQRCRYVTVFISIHRQPSINRLRQNHSCTVGSTTVVMVIYGLHWKWWRLTPCQRHPSEPIDRYRWQMTWQIVPNVGCNWRKWFWRSHWSFPQRDKDGCAWKQKVEAIVKGCILGAFQQSKKAVGSATPWKQ